MLRRVNVLCKTLCCRLSLAVTHVVKFSNVRVVSSIVFARIIANENGVHSCEKKKSARSPCVIFLRVRRLRQSVFQPLSLMTNRCAGLRRKRVAPHAQWDALAQMHCYVLPRSLSHYFFFFFLLLRELVVGKQ
uniref:Secreted protein n=1 Tax=Rhipicephalus appendiculatus TaxID=34631 RepID=A0A131YEI9_RHIAP